MIANIGQQLYSEVINDDSIGKNKNQIPISKKSVRKKKVDFLNK